MVIYYVQPGDTLASIAGQFNVSLQALQSQNNLAGSAIYAGEMLMIPTGTGSAPPPNSTPYIVRSGDTLFSIGQTYNIPLETMLRLNPLPNPDIIFPGQVIYLPTSIADPATISCPAGHFAYTVQAGDSIYLLARRFGVTVEAIVAANLLGDPDRLSGGQGLCIPNPTQCPAGSVAHTIRSGDTLFNIAMQLNTTVSTLMSLNPGVDPQNLAIGQNLCVPVSTAIAASEPLLLQAITSDPQDESILEAPEENIPAQASNADPDEALDFEEALPSGIFDLSLKELRQRMSEGELTSVQLVEACLERIAACDASGPNLNTIRQMNMNLLNEAAAYDREQREGHVRGPLHGIPVMIKDNIDIAGMPNTAGSYALRDNFPALDAPLISRLKDAGALILAKGNLTEWANFMSDHMTNGYSALGGTVLNPYGPGSFDVSGSSSGPAAAVAAGLAPIAVGTETQGSIISPSNANSVFGLKPTIGMVSRTGIIPIAPSQDTAGPIGRSVEDIALLFQVMIGEDYLDLATLGTEKYHQNFLECLKTDSLKGSRIGVARQAVARQDEERQALFAMTLEELEQMGVELVDIEMPGYADLLTYSSNVLLYEFKPALNAYLKNVASHLPVHSIDQLLNFNADNPHIELKYGQFWIESAVLTSGTLTDPAYINDRLRDIRNSRELGIDYALQQYDVSAVIFPGNSAASIGAKAGYPTLNMPIGYLANGQPYGMTWTASAFQECVILAYAYAYSLAYPKRKWPTSCP